LVECVTVVSHLWGSILIVPDISQVQICHSGAKLLGFLFTLVELLEALSELGLCKGTPSDVLIDHISHALLLKLVILSVAPVARVVQRGIVLQDSFNQLI